jgi:acyl-CoA thioesterase-1
MRLRRLAFVAVALAIVSACSLRYVSCRLPTNNESQQPADALSAPDLPLSAQPGGQASVLIAFLGDSLTAGYGLDFNQAYPSVIEEMFHDDGYGGVGVINAGVTGDTTAGGLRRAEQLLQPNVRVLVVALGGNDALRGLTPKQTHDNLAAIIDGTLQRNVAVVLAGMEAPTNLGADYQAAFHNVFLQLDREYQGSIAFVPFLLEGVAGNPSLNQADGIHPTAEGARRIAQLLYPTLRRIVEQGQ